ncbi:MAG: UDP-N-acetylmuramoylalanine--D-glutamate ligase [Candidatus Vogelbacteria bacterium RIFOXYD1_FULL_44_32]|uniref:UDP-N-acetylmuramoylalanine--D-glutamate ligase n=1 Tax=Candidatus Vogelbacteria bacterium RIFOXYD1_FULL_44_32 TaxID=1802438 RepID=A0A1G2QD84_9BACT|nr:MAG: UDP-N-acetylmuramoylalanine--D-glutamate ligase [Candidatus Vogelbacteria bacterium RIFOXYD1_FULL_44_32]
MNWQEYLKGKKVTIIGLGLNGGALNDAKFLSKHGAILTITDIKTAEELKPSIDALAGYENITYVLGEHRLGDFQTADFILQPGNVPLDSVYLAEARKNNIPIHVGESLFVHLAPEVLLVGVTGTRGKSTVTHLLYEILKKGLNLAEGEVGQNSQGRRLFLGGNVRNVSTLALLEEIKAGDTVVMELDSWALRGLGDIKKSPQVSVFTNFMKDHLNFYKGDIDMYLEDKAQIFLHQNVDDTLVLGSQVESLVRERYGNEIKSKIIVPPVDLPADWQIKMPGAHNRYNTSLAVAAARELGVAEKVIKEVAESFRGLPGRLEYLGEKEGITYYNDNNATTPDGTIAAVKSFPDHKGKIILIGGGADKELDFTEYSQVMPDYVKKFILFTGKATEKIKAVLPASADVVVVDSMDEALKQAWACSGKGDMILLSPGAASFGVFQNEYQRNDQFVELVKNI